MRLNPQRPFRMSLQAGAAEKPRVPIPPLRLAAITVLLFSLFALLPRALANPPMEASFLGASAVLWALFFLLRYRAIRSARALDYSSSRAPPTMCSS